MPAKKGASPVMAVDKLHVPSSALVPSADEQSNSPRSPSRRNFLRRGSTIAGSAFAAGATGISMSQAETLAIPPSNLGYGKPIPETDYGVPSKYESDVRRRRSDVLKNRQNFSDWSMTPLQHQHGIVTPNGLIYERHRNGTPDIDPE